MCLLQNAILCHTVVPFLPWRHFQVDRSSNIPSEAKEERLSSELQRPDTDFLYAAFTNGSVVENIASEGIVHLVMR
jgi:hypothetical protein